MVDNRTNFDWDQYFQRENQSVFQRLISVYRHHVISPAMRYYAETYFPAQGIFLEAGAGTSQSSARISSRERQLVALDLNHYVLARHNVLPAKIQGDIVCLPVQSSSLAGIWNLGVMEHLTAEQIVDALKEFGRVIRPDGVIVLLWPPVFAPFQIVLNAVAWVMRVFCRREVEFFPNEISLWRSRRQVQRLIERAGLRLERTHFNLRDLFSYVVVVIRKGSCPQTNKQDGP